MTLTDLNNLVLVATGLPKLISTLKKEIDRITYLFEEVDTTNVIKGTIIHEIVQGNKSAKTLEVEEDLGSFLVVKIVQNVSGPKRARLDKSKLFSYALTTEGRVVHMLYLESYQKAVNDLREYSAKYVKAKEELEVFENAHYTLNLINDYVDNHTTDFYVDKMTTGAAP